MTSIAIHPNRMLKSRLCDEEGMNMANLKMTQIDAHRDQ